MRSKIFKIALLALSSVGVISCEDFLDQSPDSSLSAEQVYSDYTTYQQSVDYAYSLIINPLDFEGALPGVSPMDLGGGICDEGAVIDLW